MTQNLSFKDKCISNDIMQYCTNSEKKSRFYIFLKYLLSEFSSVYE